MNAWANWHIFGQPDTILAREQWALVGTQCFDGVANGIFGVLNVVVAEDLAAGTGRYNMVFGLVSTCVQVGAACSLLIGEYIVEVAGGGEGGSAEDAERGYNTAFRFLGLVALIPVLAFVAGVGETAPHLARGAREAKSKPGRAGVPAVGVGAQLCDRFLFAPALRVKMHAAYAARMSPPP